MDHHQLALEALEDILNPYDLRRPLADFLAAVMFDDDEEDDQDADDQDDGDEDDEDEEDDDDEEEDSKPKGKGQPTRRQRELQREAARRRVENKTLKQERDDLAKKLKAFEDKDKSKGEKAESDLKAETARADRAEGELDKLRRRVAIRDLADDHKVTDVKYFTFLLSEEGIELDEDGEWPDDAEKDVKKLVRKHKARLVGSANGDSEEDDEDDGDEPPRVGPTGRNRRPGRTNKAGRRQELNERFPALAQRR